MVSTKKTKVSERNPEVGLSVDNLSVDNKVKKELFINNNSIRYTDKLKKDLSVVNGDKIIDISSSEVKSIDDIDMDKKRKSKWWRYRGFLFTLISSLVFSVTALLVKLLKSQGSSSDYSCMTIALWRYQGAFLPSIPLILFFRLYDKGSKVQLINVDSKKESSVEPDDNRWAKFKVIVLLLTRSILSCNALLLHFYSLKFLEIGDALVISSSTPALAYFFAHIMLGEPCGFVPILTSLTTLMGVVIIIKPPHLTGEEEFDFDTLVGVGLALGCTFLATCSYVALRLLRRVHCSVTMFAFGSVGFLENLTLTLIFGVFTLPHGTRDWLLAAALASLTFLGQMSIIMALKSEQTGPVSLVRTMDIIFGYCLQVIFSQVVPDIYSLVGSAIVLFGVVFTGIRKYLADLPANHKTRTKFWFILK